MVGLIVGVIFTITIMKLNKHEIFKYFNNDTNKKFYLNWFQNVCSEISMITQKEITESDMGIILEGYFKQVKEGGN